MRNKARAACGEDRFGTGRGHEWEWGSTTRWSLRRRLRMEGLREGRKGERAEGAEAEREAAGRERGGGHGRKKPFP